MKIHVLTLFPQMFQGPLTESILKRAVDTGALEIAFHDLRQYGEGKHRQIDDKPYGGGAGMVMMPGPLVDAIESASLKEKPYRIYLSPRGTTLSQKKVQELATKKSILLLCGHYEGVDQRVIDGWIDEEISIGEYVLTGGELPAMVLIDAVARHVPGVLGKEQSAAEESFSPALEGKREYPHYTRPEEFRGMKVPDILLSGNHQKIAEWRQSKLS